MTVSTAADALAGLPHDDPIIIGVQKRFVDALDELHISCRLLGLDVSEQTAPFALRADAWLWRTTLQLRRPLPSREEPHG
jgi:hypothetical protein